MRTLRLVALSDDGRSLILVAEGADGETDERYELPVDDRVRAAARGDARRLTQIDVDLGTELPPRIIQSRIRSGETPEQVAAATGARVERIMRFAHPVLQERERIAEQAREARVRLSEGTPTVALARFMTERLRLIDADLDAVGWDAYRDDDGTWVVTGTWRAGDMSGTTRWSFDLPARTCSSMPLRWLRSSVRWSSSSAAARYPVPVTGPVARGSGRGVSRSIETGRLARCTGAAARPAGTSGTTRTWRVPSAKSIVAASSGVTVRAGRSKLQRVVPDRSPARQAPVTTQVPSSSR